MTIIYQAPDHTIELISENDAQKLVKTCKNTQESPLYSASETILTDFKTPFYNMRETVDKIGFSRVYF